MSWKQFWSAPNSISQIAFMCRAEAKRAAATAKVAYRLNDRNSLTSLVVHGQNQLCVSNRGREWELKIEVFLPSAPISNIQRAKPASQPASQERTQELQNWNCYQYYLGNSASVVIKSNQHDHHDLSFHLLWNSMENAYVQFAVGPWKMQLKLSWPWSLEFFPSCCWIF